MRVTYQAPSGGLTVTLERAELATVRGTATHRLTVWFTDRCEQFTATVSDAEARRLLAGWAGTVRDGAGELHVGE